ncbi:hypothetical protein [Azotobacter beijerinckii]|uniref:hypothetical protein n=1 Tax=Azotobacter beijerinckii TaxID=170623 RepID=UPI001113AB8A|nr:hypothetical protein [Azotobacter beijerinckii]
MEARQAGCGLNLEQQGASRQWPFFSICVTVLADRRGCSSICVQSEGMDLAVLDTNSDFDRSPRMQMTEESPMKKMLPDAE